MTLSAAKSREGLIAFQRFGLGAKPGQFEKVARNARNALIEEVTTPKIALINDDTLPSYRKAAADSQRDYEKYEGHRRRELDARIKKHMSVRIGFVERLVMFWSNHFSMSVNKASAVRGTIGQLERDVIRKHVLGDFTSMLIGVMKHPAMQAYLDNSDSVGPNSEYGAPRGIGINENLARESMELHTVGSGGGYTEEDVTAMALILTGWSYVRGWEADNNWNGGTKKNRGRFIFREDWHEPGPITLMGKTYPDEGQKRGIKALKFLARQPETAEHIAFKLVHHFITDEPTPAMVNPVKQAFIKSGGNLKKVALALIELPEALTGPLDRLRTPYELAVAQFRAMKRKYNQDQYWSFASPLYSMNNMAWECPTPDGYTDETYYWLNPEAVTLRLETAQMSGWVYDEYVGENVVKMAKGIFGGALSRATRERVEAAGSTSRALTILFSSPEFQRR